MSNPDISLVMSVYNGEKFLEKTIESVLKQTFTNFEFIISNNGSTDKTSQIIQKFKKTDDRIIFFDHEDLGFANSLNQAIALAKSNLIGRIDADDIMLPDRLAKQYLYLLENQDVSLTSCLAYYINQHGKRIGKTFSDIYTIDVNKDYISKDEPIGLLHPGAMFYKNAFIHVGGYREQFAPAEDIDLWNRFNDHKYWATVQQEYLMEYRMIHGTEIGRNFKKSRIKYEWLRDCMRLRRQGRGEIDWHDFLIKRNNISSIMKINRYRKMQAKYLYRMAGIQFGANQIFSFIISLAGSMILQPSYFYKKLSNQIYNG
ncbi:glycosyltransferase family 2 protein [Gammaproteobacteria bacterium]|nr:glycosyltransferase family 2 protein [Gammaproteobacteria bacterium]